MRRLIVQLAWSGPQRVALHRPWLSGVWSSRWPGTGRLPTGFTPAGTPGRPERLAFPV